MRTRGIVGLGLIGMVLGLAGCNTEPSGGELPPPRAVGSPEEEAKKARDAANEAYSHMGKGGGVPGVPNAIPKNR
jgi:hypothetical protein